MFQGASKLSLDAKGRVAMPARYREDIARMCESQLVVTVDRDRCLLVYPKPVWDRIKEELTTLPTADRQVRRLQRLMIGYAEEVTPDSAGRIRITQEQRDFARLGKKVVLIGQGPKFELWDEPTWSGLSDEWCEDEEGTSEPSAALASLSW